MMNEERNGSMENKKLGYSASEETYHVPCNSLFRVFSPMRPWTKVVAFELHSKLAGIQQNDSLQTMRQSCGATDSLRLSTRPIRKAIF